MNRKKFHKNLLTKASIISIVTAFSNYSTAVETSGVPALDGVAIIKDATFTDKAGLANWQQIDQLGEYIKDVYVKDPLNKAITYKGEHALVANAPNANIIAINLAGQNAKALVIQKDTSIGSILNGTLPIIIGKGKTLKLTGAPATKELHGFKAGANVYKGVGDITIKGKQGKLIIEPTDNIAAPGSEAKINLPGKIIANAASSGIVEILGPCQIEQEVASKNIPLNSINLDTTQQVDFLKDVYAANTHIKKPGIFNIKGSLFSNNILFAEDFELNDQDVIDLNNKVAILRVADGQKIVGNISQQGAINNEIIFLGAGSIEQGVIRDLGKLSVGKGEVKLISGAHKIKEIQGNGSRTLSLASNFTLEGSINATGGQPLNLTFTGGDINRISGIVGSKDNPVGDIQIQHGTTTFEEEVKADNIIIGNGATAIFNNNTTAQNIRGLDNNQGKVKFDNNSNIVVNSKIGELNQINTIEIANGDVEVNEQVSVGKVLFSSDKESTLTLSKASTITAGVTTTGNNLHTLVIKEDFDTLAAPFGSDTNRLKDIQLQNDKQITINSNDVHSNISTAVNNTGKVLFNADGNFTYEVGSSDLKLSEVIFESNLEVKGDVYANTMRVAEGKTVTFSGTKLRSTDIAASIIDGVPSARTAESFNFNTVIDAPLGLNLAADSTVNFSTSTLIKSPINNGHINCTSDTWFQQKINNAAAVNFAPEKLTILEGDISATNITADNAHIIIVNNDINMLGNLQAQNLTLDLGANQLRYSGNAVLVGDLAIHLFYNTATSTGGHIKIQGLGTMDLTAVDQLLVKVAARSDINNLPGALHELFVSDNGTVPLIEQDKIIVEINEENNFVRWVMDPETLTLRAQDVSNEVLRRSVRSAPPLQQQLITQLLTADSNSEAGQYKNSLGFISTDQNATDVSMDKLISPAVAIGQSPLINTFSEMTEEGVLQTSNHATLRMAFSPKRAIGAGDDESRQYGIWGSPLYGYATQKMQEGVSGYKLKSLGAIIGIDTFINDNFLIGAAYSRLNTKMSYKNQKAGDKTKGRINIFSLYSSYNFPSNWLVEGIFSYGRTKVKNLEGHLIATGANRNIMETAVGKYKTTYYGGKLLAGYNYQTTNQLVLTPLIGLRYSHFADSGYQITGTSFLNATYQKRKYHKLESLVGLRALTSVALNDIALIPEFHGYFHYALKRKSPLIEARLGGLDQPLPSKTINPNRRYYNIGTSLTARYKMMEYGVAYNVDLAKKYIAHQGSLKLRVNL
ncbi:autotransporter outer membrane beta-barrel domain-containing protein [Candidatus Tisiphia endosymbiont of Nemotelus uliginosus]|uniref:autotransporter family protein n=1 Tax=Candidatus Tisiphia endosymbiont of Nemotelus uliginosus TaxID=3077926 RepID=UPI0035C8F6E4